MQKTPELEKVCLEIRRQPLDWNSMIDRATTNSKFDSKIEYDFGMLGGEIGEAWLDLGLERVAKENPDLKITLDPIEDDTDSLNYRFSYDYRHKLIVHINNNTYSECDRVAMVGDPPLPVVFEIRMSSRRHAGFNRASIHHLLGLYNQMRILPPIAEFFDTDVKNIGYAVVMPLDIYLDMRRNLSIVYECFTKANGIVVPFPATLRDFRRDLLTNLNRRNIKFKTNPIE